MIKFRKISLASLKDFEYIEKWDNSEDAYLFRPNFEENKFLPKAKASETYERHDSNVRISYMIELDGRVVGKVGYTLSFSQLVKDDGKTAWLDLVIGEESARGKGIGPQALDFIEGEAKKAGLSRMELGVFEFNARAHKLYKKKGYKEIAILDKITFYKGKWHRDIRMEKEL